MQHFFWEHGEDSERQAAALAAAASEPGVVVVELEAGGGGGGLPWPVVERWSRCRAITVAVISGSLGSPALDLALCADLVYLRSNTELHLAAGPGPPAPGVLWALGRAGRKALARGLLSTGALEATEAVDLGIAHGVLTGKQSPPVPTGASLNAATAARDLMRARGTGGAGLALELAAFRLLFAAGDPGEGATAFLEKRDPSF